MRSALAKYQSPDISPKTAILSSAKKVELPMENSEHESPRSPRCYKVSKSDVSVTTAAAQTDIEPSRDITSTTDILDVVVRIILRRRKRVWGIPAKLPQAVPAFQHEGNCPVQSDGAIEGPPLSDQAAAVYTQQIRRGPIDRYSAFMHSIAEPPTGEIPFSIEQNTWLLRHGSEGRGINGLRAWKRIELDFIARFQKRSPAPLLRIKFNRLKYEQRRKNLFEKQQCREKERDDAVKLSRWHVAQTWLMENIHKFQTDSCEVDWQMLADLFNDTVEWSVTGAWLRVFLEWFCQE